MKKIDFIAALFIVTSAISTGATAQNVYKCGPTTYSQTPCPDGVKLPPVEAPSRAQQSESEQATARDARTADRMERTRLQQEQRDLKANTPTKTATEPKPAARANKVAEPKDFVAEVPGTEKPPAKRKTKSE